jgi:hypothetical protein
LISPEIVQRNFQDFAGKGMKDQALSGLRQDVPEKQTMRQLEDYHKTPLV